MGEPKGVAGLSEGAEKRKICGPCAAAVSKNLTGVEVVDVGVVETIVKGVLDPSGVGSTKLGDLPAFLNTLGILQ